MLHKLYVIYIYLNFTHAIRKHTIYIFRGLKPRFYLKLQLE